MFERITNTINFLIDNLKWTSAKVPFVKLHYVVDHGSLIGVVALADLANQASEGQAVKALEGISQ